MMAFAANFDCPEKDKFFHCFYKLAKFILRDDDASKTDLNLLLDQLNSFEYDSKIVKDLDGSDLIVKLCSTIPLYEDRLVVKFAHVINNWKRKQMLVMTDQCMKITTEYLIKSVQRCQSWATPDILRTLGAVMYENCDRVDMFHEELLGNQGILIQLINNQVVDADVLKEAVMCVECLTMKSLGGGYLSANHIETCFNLLCMLLHRIPTTKQDQYTQIKILISCLRGLQNMLQVTKIMPVDKLGILLAAVRSYMFYGLYNQLLDIPESLYPSPLTKHELPVMREISTSTTPVKDNSEKEGPKKTKKKTKKRNDRQRENKSRQDTEASNETEKTLESTRSPTVTMATQLDADMSMFTPAWMGVSSSDSEWSDTEGGQASRIRSSCTKIRQCALSCFYWVVKGTDKKLMFGYWASFIPDSPSTSGSETAQTLFTIILKDPSPKCRMGALAALSMLIDGTKLLLSAAEDSEEKQPATFTPFSVILGATIKEVHRCLLLALVSEDFPITLTQLIKCFGTVIANVPYHRMRPGLLSRIVKQIRHFINHRDPNVRVACLTCLGAMASIQPPLMEVCHIIQPPRPPTITKQSTNCDFEPSDQGRLREPEHVSGRGQDSGFSSSPSIHSPGGALQQGIIEYSGGTTPRKGASSSGVQTPVFTDQMLQAHARDVSWVVRLCVKNILPHTGESSARNDDPYVEPLPVRLESLQVLANLTKVYFPIIRNCVPLLQELIHQCYCDTDPVIKLHTAKLLDEFSQVLLNDLQGGQADSTSVTNKLDKQEVLEFWLSLLNGPIQDILQNPSYGAVRATTCDCIANIGDEIFTCLPIGIQMEIFENLLINHKKDKQIMCLTVVLGLAGDEDRFIRASAVRTLGVYVLYKSLRTDISFLTDSTSAILDSVQDKNIAVRVKAVWSLANLCDALALNREDGDEEFTEEFSDVLLLNIITMATKACQDSDKVKANGVRSLGNILRYILKKHLAKERFSQAVGNGVKALMKNISVGTMKVRWNACYAISNMYKNTDLNPGSASWNVDVMNSLCVVVRDCKNFKVRINAATALSSPKERSQYGDAELYCRVWKGMIEAFGTAEDIADYIDFRYRDNLTDQICITVFHLIDLLQTTDTDNLSTLLKTEADVLCSYMDKYFTARPDVSHLVKSLTDNLLRNLDNPSGDINPLPDASHLGSANQRLEELTSETLTNDQSFCIQTLTTMCKQLTLAADTTRVKPQPKSSFLQTYD